MENKIRVVKKEEFKESQEMKFRLGMSFYSGQFKEFVRLIKIEFKKNIHEFVLIEDKDGKKEFQFRTNNNHKNRVDNIKERIELIELETRGGVGYPFENLSIVPTDELS